jgi:cell surface protein SprA
MDEQINLRATIEPSPDLKILVDVKKETMSSYQEIYRYDEFGIDDISGKEFPNWNKDTKFASLSPSRSGSYRISFLSIKTAFNSSNSETESEVFKTFENNLLIFQERLKIRNPGTEYDTASQDVLIPHLLRHTAVKIPTPCPLLHFQNTRCPNWRVDYTDYEDRFLQKYISKHYHFTRLSIFLRCGKFFKRPGIP